MAGVVFTQSAQTDLLEAWLFIAEENQTAADRTLDAIELQAQALSTQPLIGRARPELAEGVRSWPTSTPYILYYLTGNDSVTILRVLHHARDIQSVSL
ncbi:MAG: type II toxin-antitoxin system RelE/ParE family toxin [Burkholderiales bacterium]|nr:type II toxin-antitoxin system RelE/ParE family toxin [Burkholderiales bacterium]